MVSEKRFRLVFQMSEDLSVSQLWPDGDAPDDPSADDVRRLIDECGGIAVIEDWSLRSSAGSDSIEVYEVKPRRSACDEQPIPHRRCAGDG